MSAQLEVVKFRDLLPLRSIPRIIPGLEQPSIELNGTDFSNVDRILINEVEAPEFIILTKTRVVVQLPDAATNGISTIEVISSEFTKDFPVSKLQFEIGNKTRTITGVLKLLQLFVKWLLQSPGSDIYNPDRGGGLQKLAGKVMVSKRMENLLSTITRSVERTTSQIRSAQIATANLPSDERLLSATVADVDIFPDRSEVRVKIRLTTVLGNTALSTLEL